MSNPQACTSPHPRRPMGQLGSVGPGEKARRMFSSTGGRVLENVRLAFSFMETICPKICSKSSLKSAKSPLPVDIRPSKSTLLFKSSINNRYSKKLGNTVHRTIHRESSEAIDHHKYLGVELSSDLNC